jgi:hypothetical protein
MHSQPKLPGVLGVTKCANKKVYKKTIKNRPWILTANFPLHSDLDKQNRYGSLMHPRLLLPTVAAHSLALGTRNILTLGSHAVLINRRFNVCAAFWSSFSPAASAPAKGERNETQRERADALRACERALARECVCERELASVCACAARESLRERVCARFAGMLSNKLMRAMNGTAKKVGHLVPVLEVCHLKVCGCMHAAPPAPAAHGRPA